MNKSDEGSIQTIQFYFDHNILIDRYNQTSQRMFYIYSDPIFSNNNNFFLYYLPKQIQPFEKFPNITNNPNHDLQFQSKVDQNSLNNSSEMSLLQMSKSKSIEYLTGQNLNLMSQKDKQVSIKTQRIKNQSMRRDTPKITQIKLDFRIQWKNENRNIVPNLTNQMISFVLKKSRSQHLVHKLFQLLPHDENSTKKKFYLYMKKIKDSITHYVNQNALLIFLEIHQPKCELYNYEQQLFYMRICRILLMKFLQNEAILISLTSNRMSSAKRMIHLIAREALKKKFLQLCKQHMF